MEISHLKAPIAARKEKPMLHHGDLRSDSYYWLKERDSNPEVVAYLEEENAYTRAVLGSNKVLEDQIYAEILARIPGEDSSVPFLCQGMYFQIRFSEGQQYPALYSSQSEDFSEEKLLIDQNLLAAGQAYYRLQSYSPSPDHRFLAYAEDKVSRRLFDLKILDTTTGLTLKEILPNTSGECVWSADASYLYYVRKDPETLRECSVWRHKPGTGSEVDDEVFYESDETFHISIAASRSEKFLFIRSSQTTKDEVWYLPLAGSKEAPRCFFPRTENIEYQLDHLEDRFYLLTNQQAENFCLMGCPEDFTDPANWELLIPHDEEVLLEQFLHFPGCLAVAQRYHGISQIRIIPAEGDGQHLIAFPEEACVASLGLNETYDLPYIRIVYQSLCSPPTVFDYYWETRELRLRKQQKVVGTFQSENYKSQRFFIPSVDGKEIPVSLVYHKKCTPPGNHPLLIYGYGSYGISMEPTFSQARLSLLDRGFIFAIAHIRGGQEMGRKWYNEGKLLHKRNTFSDFLACTEWFQMWGWTSPEKCFAMGGSAGGLLMGAIANMAPQLYRGIVAAVPFVDVVTTMLDESIPLTTFEYDEWGNPNDPIFYHYMKSYSPIDNVKAQAYPAMLVTTGLHDSQVQYWEPAKWVAKLRATQTGIQPLLLHTNMETGHSGATGRFTQYRETAMEYAFFLSLCPEGAISSIET